MEGRDYVLPDDIKRLAVPVFAHRVVLNQRVGLSSRSSQTAERLLEEILNGVEGAFVRPPARSTRPGGVCLRLNRRPL